VSVSVEAVVNHGLVSVDGAQNRPAVDDDLDRWLADLLRNEEDEHDLVHTRLLHEHCSGVIVVLRELQVIWRCVHGFLGPLDVLVGKIEVGRSFVESTLFERLLGPGSLKGDGWPLRVGRGQRGVDSDGIGEGTVPDPLAKAVEWTQALVDVFLFVGEVFKPLDG